jgi:hypothetical protein
VRVTLADANHCPGAAQLLFELPGGGPRYLHCGDMRYDPAMETDPALAAARGCDAVFLDTTYAKPAHTFPGQREVVERVASEVAARLAGGGGGGGGEEEEGAEGPAAGQEQQQQEEAGAGPAAEQEPAAGQQQAAAAPDAPPRGRFPVLCLISTYVIGKERLLLEVSARTGFRVCVTARKHEVLRLCLRDARTRGPHGVAAAAGAAAAGSAGGWADPDVAAAEALLARCFTTDPFETPVHVVEWGEGGGMGAGGPEGRRPCESPRPAGGPLAPATRRAARQVEGRAARSRAHRGTRRTRRGHALNPLNPSPLTPPPHPHPPKPPNSPRPPWRDVALLPPQFRQHGGGARALRRGAGAAGPRRFGGGGRGAAGRGPALSAIAEAAPAATKKK